MSNLFRLRFVVSVGLDQLEQVGCWCDFFGHDSMGVETVLTRAIHNIVLPVPLNKLYNFEKTEVEEKTIKKLRDAP